MWDCANSLTLVQQQKKTLTVALMLTFVHFSPGVLVITCVKSTKNPADYWQLKKSNYGNEVHVCQPFA